MKQITLPHHSYRHPSTKACQAAADAGDGPAMLELASRHLLTVPHNDLRGALHWARRAQARGVAAADEVLGMLHMMGVPTADAWAGLALVRRAAQAGVLSAQLTLGKVLLGALGGRPGAPIDVVEGHRWVRRAADAGWTPALTPLAVTYLWGLGTPEDPAEAMRRVAAAALGGDPESGRLVTYILSRGSQVTRDNLGALLRAGFAEVTSAWTPELPLGSRGPSFFPGA